MDRVERALSRLKQDYEPDPKAERRVRMALGMSIAAGAALGASGSASLAPATAAGAKLTLGGVLKWTLLSCALGVVGWAGGEVLLGGNGALMSPPSEPPAATEIAQTQSTDEPVKNAVELSEEPEVAAPEVPAPEPSKEKAQVVQEPRAINQVPTSKVLPAKQEREASPGSSLAELRLLREASAALRSGKLVEAQKVLAQHRELYPNSQLSRERQGLSLLAGCAQGRDAALVARARRYVAVSPNLPLSDALRKQCIDSALP